MRFMMLIKANRDFEAGVPPPPELVVAMGTLADEMIERGVLLSAEGMKPSSHGTRIRHAYFPTASFISDITPINGNSGLEVGLIGNEGMCGIALTLGVDASAHQSLVQGTGPALRIGAAAFRRERAQSPAMRRLLERYAFVLMTQLAQAAVCISSHVVEQRLARWLLMSHDRAHADTFDVTHAFLAKMLAVRRVGVTTAAGTLQKKKLIRYARGRMEIVNRRGLEAASCACYRIDRETWQRLLG